VASAVQRVGKLRKPVRPLTRGIFIRYSIHQDPPAVTALRFTPAR
jgi:hypothetical protein